MNAKQLKQLKIKINEYERELHYMRRDTIRDLSDSADAAELEVSRLHGLVARLAEIQMSQDFCLRTAECLQYLNEVDHRLEWKDEAMVDAAKRMTAKMINEHVISWLSTQSVMAIGEIDEARLGRCAQTLKRLAVQWARVVDVNV